jgi:hypothetical protein
VTNPAAEATTVINLGWRKTRFPGANVIVAVVIPMPKVTVAWLAVTKL